MAFDITGIEHDKLLPILRRFADRLSAELADALPGDFSHVIRRRAEDIGTALNEMLKDDAACFDYLAEDISRAVGDPIEDRADKHARKAEERAEEIESLRESPVLSVLSFGPEPLEWNGRENAFICPRTRRRYYVVPEERMRELSGLREGP